jgi:hypothetical protein
MRASLLAAALLLAAPPTSEEPAEAEAEEAVYRVDRGPGELPLLVPRHERLEYGVHLDLGLLGEPRVGTVTIETRVESFGASPLLVRGEQQRGERVVIEAVARGSYKLYEVRDTISTLMLPGPWPKIIHRKVASGSQHRRRELSLGTRAGEFVAEYRSDHHCDGCQSRAHFLEPTFPWQDESHCPECRRAEHRVWKEPRSKSVPADALDMLSGIQLARTMVAQGEERLSFKLLDKLELWLVDVERGPRQRLEVAAGTFDAVELRLKTRPPPDDPKRTEDFEGLFGIQGEIALWFDERSGRPVLITGRLPAGPLDLDVRVELVRAR